MTIKLNGCIQNGKRSRDYYDWFWPNMKGPSPGQSLCHKAEDKQRQSTATLKLYYQASTLKKSFSPGRFERRQQYYGATQWAALLKVQRAGAMLSFPRDAMENNRECVYTGRFTV